MATPKEDNKTRKTAAARRKFDPNHVALADADIRELVLEITEREGVEAFIRRMVALMNALRAGHTEQVELIAEESRDRSFKNLMSAVTEAVHQGRILAAKNTAFYAASYAYQNSLDYVCGLMGYLDRFNQASEGPAALPSNSHRTDLNRRR